ncbi:MAG: alpha/beta fold hydrolase [bacterium]
MKKIFLFIIFLVVAISLLFFFTTRNRFIVSPVAFPTPTEKPLLKYSFEKLRQTQFPKNNIQLDRLYGDTPDSTAQVFYFDTPKKPNESVMDTVSGLINIPKTPGKYPMIVMLRGYVPDEMYLPGAGTQHVAEALARSGYITLAPDFLGFGQSSAPSQDSFEARFQTYTTVLTLLSSLSTLNEGMQASYSGVITADVSRVGVWGHSNGGHIALSVLVISGKQYPTVLWAPVSKSFPYSILYYSDDAADHGKALRVVLANFEHDYNADLFSPLNYYAWIKAPLSIHQGDADTEVPQQWSADLVSALKKSDINVSYHVYPGDHNMLPSAWNDAVNDSVSFFDAHFKTND